MNNLLFCNVSDLKPCPFCGSKVIMKKLPLWSGSRGYIDCYTYVIECDNVDCHCQIGLGRNNTVYNTDEDAIKEAVKHWNTRSV